MTELTEIFENSINLIFLLNPDLLEIILLSLKVSSLALLFSCIFSLPVGAFLAVSKFSGRELLILIFNSMMGLPPVFVGLVLYIILSASGPLGALELIYTPAAMIIAQFFLITPIIVSLTRQVLEEMTREYDELLNSLQANTKEKILTILWDARYSLLTCILAGLGRSLSEVGAIIIVGGNIAHVTRVMTTTMLLETTKGNLEIAIALGFVLIFISILINLLVFVFFKIVDFVQTVGAPRESGEMTEEEFREIPVVQESDP